MTEKFFDVLSTDMVPIVYSGANYTELGVPPGPQKALLDEALGPLVGPVPTGLPDRRRPVGTGPTTDSCHCGKTRRSIR